MDACDGQGNARFGGGGWVEAPYGHRPPPTLPTPENRQMSNGTCLPDGAQGHTAQGQITEQEGQTERGENVFLPTNPLAPPPKCSLPLNAPKKMHTHAARDKAGGAKHANTQALCIALHLLFWQIIIIIKIRTK